LALWRAESLDKGICVTPFYSPLPRFSVGEGLFPMVPMVHSPALDPKRNLLTLCRNLSGKAHNANSTTSRTANRQPMNCHACVGGGRGTNSGGGGMNCITSFFLRDAPVDEDRIGGPSRCRRHRLVQCALAVAPVYSGAAVRGALVFTRQRVPLPITVLYPTEKNNSA
jgi:hypothetical protein